MSHGVYLNGHGGRKPQVVVNPLLRKIQRACRSTLHEPDLAANLDIADYINEKQGATARDACITLVELINSRNQHTSIFAISLLDVLVKNCGYPVHLQISRKEFLNELVRRFPEHPSMRYSRVQKLVLTAIEEWYQTIAKHGENKQDMGYIRDMHRLLKFKGYVFPKIDPKDLAVLKPTKQLKTATEIQKEQEIKQAARLEELIRRGKPEDLREANKLMKVMAGFKEDNAIQIKQSMNHELNKLKRKADIFNEMLSNTENTGSIKTNTALSELYSSLKTAQPKIKQIIEEEHEDDQFIQSLLMFNDSLNQLVTKYEFLKNGNTNEASAINVNTSSLSTLDSNHNGALANEINLIDFDDEPSPSPPVESENILLTTENSTTSTTNAATSNDLIDLLGDFNNLNLSNTSNNNTNFGMNGNISLGSAKPAEPILTSDLEPTPPPITASNDMNDLLGFDNDFITIPQPPIPVSSEPTTTHGQRVTVNKSNNLRVDFVVSRISSSSVKLEAILSNITKTDFSDVTFSLAVPKSMSLKLENQSHNKLEAHTSDDITQVALIENALSTSIKPLKVKWKVNYNENGIQPIEETAVYTLPQV